jgi:hypothetical protein
MCVDLDVSIGVYRLSEYMHAYSQNNCQISRWTSKQLNCVSDWEHDSVSSFGCPLKILFYFGQW